MIPPLPYRAVLEPSPVHISSARFVKCFHCLWRAGHGPRHSAVLSSSGNTISLFLFLAKNETSRSHWGTQREVGLVPQYFFSLGRVWNVVPGAGSGVTVLFCTHCTFVCCCCCCLLRQLIFGGYCPISFLCSHSHWEGAHIYIGVWDAHTQSCAA